MIGKSPKPRWIHAFNDMKHKPCVYLAQPNAWMNGAIFKDIVTHINERMKHENRHILLIVDNASCHNLDVEFSNVKVVYLAPNTTSHLQTNDNGLFVLLFIVIPDCVCAGIINALKCRYKAMLVQYFIDCLDNAEDAEQITVLKAMIWIRAAWTAISPVTIQKCWKKTRFV